MNNENKNNIKMIIYIPKYLDLIYFEFNFFYQTAILFIIWIYNYKYYKL